MPDKLDLWLASRPLYRQAVGALSDQAPPERLPDQATFTNGLTLKWAPSLETLPPWTDGAGPRAFLDASYAAVKVAAGRGWRTVWFNPRWAFAPEFVPVHDLDLRDLARLPEIGSALLGKPSLAQCLDWWEAWEVPENIRRHSKAVAHSAYLLGVMLRNQGIHLDPVLAQRGGLLHDIDKIRTLRRSGAHGQDGADFLLEQGYPALAEIVREHIMSAILHPHADARAWEVKLVYLCDKLVEGDQLVPFDERLAALYERYPHYRETMRRAAGPVRALSDQICAILSIPSHENLIFTLSELQYN